ncbi:MAG: tetratricopeptide repeat protein, partial [Muribaculaceae bacterium]|nr:tetratricopeptide repeat protein [Muribaculaceae bacterium]
DSYKADQLDNAKDLLLRSLNNPQTDKAVSDYYLGLIAIEEGKNSDAANYFSQGVAANAEYPYNYVGQGLIKLMAGDQKGAEELFKQADKLSKKDASLQIAIARAYDRVDPVRYEKQIAKQVEKARKFNMQNPDIYIFEGDQAREQKDWGKAAGMYEMASGYDNNATAAYVKYANLYTMVNPDYAIKMLNNLLSVNPNSALGQRELANAYYNKKDYANAAAQYGKYVQNPSHFKSDENRYAFLLFYGQDYQKGYDYASKLLAEDPNNFTAQRYQFMNAAQIPAMKEKLLPLAEALYAKHNQNPSANKFATIDFTLIANELLSAKRSDEAIAVLQEGIKEMPEFADFNKSLAFAYLDQNNLSKTADEYEVYL